MGGIFLVLAQVVQLYSYVLVVRILLSWVQVDWYIQPYRFIAEITDPYLNIFRRVLPPIQMGMSYMDLSPILGFAVINRIIIPMLTTLGLALR